MSTRASDILLTFAVTFALAVGSTALVIRLWNRYVVGACATDWTLALVLGFVLATAITALEVWSIRGGRSS